MNYQQILEEIYQEVQPLFTEGKVADYIPALANVNPNQFAMSIQLLDGKSFHVGESDVPFSIQSISKVFTFSMALKMYGKELYKFVNHEPSGNPFNSLVQLEYEKGIPRNPFINAGAIVITDNLVKQHNKATFDEVLGFIQKLSDDKSITYDHSTYLSEKQTGFRNYALANLMKSFNNIQNDLDVVMSTYFKQCSIKMSTKQLCRSMLFLANNGTDPLSNTEYLNMPKAKRINAVMLTCGHYDASGDFAFHVGLPGKSGVGGGIVAVIPRVMSLCVWSPRLNKHGNSLVGTKALELFTTKTKMSIF